MTHGPPPWQKQLIFISLQMVKLQLNGSDDLNKFDSYISDPDNPVPYTPGVHEERNNEYMVEDQRFAAVRPDVISYATEPLQADVTITGRLKADLFISSTGTDADVIVKIIDVTPDSADHPDYKIAKIFRL